jgi:hypothetical protein
MTLFTVPLTPDTGHRYSHVVACTFNDVSISHFSGNSDWMDVLTDECTSEDDHSLHGGFGASVGGHARNTST